MKGRKQLLRQQHLNLRNAFFAHEQKSHLICEKLLSIIPKNAKSILAYFPIQNEVNILPFLYPIAERLDLFLPFFDKIEIGKVTKPELAELHKKAKPIPTRISTLTNIDLAIVPGICFDLRGFRIGYGSGWYDKFLENRIHVKLTVGVTFDINIVEEVPSALHDIAVDQIVSEHRHLFCMK